MQALLFAAWIGCTGFAVITILETQVFYLNRHTWDVPFPKFEKIALSVWIGSFIFLFTSCCVKISVLLFYRRLVNGLYTKPWIYALHGGIAFIVAYTLAFFLTLIFTCSPTEGYWKAYSPAPGKTYRCTNTLPINIVAGVCVIVSDLYAVAMPMLMTRKFTLPRQQKFLLNVVFCLGFLVVAASSVRTYYHHSGSDSTQLPSSILTQYVELAGSRDPTSLIFDLLIWSTLELELAVICTAAPALRSLLRACRRTLGFSSKNYKSQSTESRDVPIAYGAGASSRTSASATSPSDSGQTEKAVATVRTHRSSRSGSRVTSWSSDQIDIGFEMRETSEAEIPIMLQRRRSSCETVDV